MLKYRILKRKNLKKYLTLNNLYSLIHSMIKKNIVKAILFTLLFAGGLLSQTAIYDSGGPLLPQQAFYDVKFYDIAVKVNPADSTIIGDVSIYANIVQPLDWFVLDLDTVYNITSLTTKDREGDFYSPRFERRLGKIWINMSGIRQPGKKVVLNIKYNGRPRIAPKPPWDGGFTWAKTADGFPWIATTCQLNGADIWWPCKDYPSDEADSVALHFTVPEPLVVASNGKLMSIVVNNDKTRTYNWFVSTPINNYGISLNAAPFKTISKKYVSVAGDTLNATFWVLPEHYDKGVKIFPQFLQHLRFYEETLGPYPFRADKYGIVETPHKGMEHQTIIAYGNEFKQGKYGFDELHQHELGHEWWGNLVTAYDWKDFWLHEGFCAYMQPLYAEKLGGEKEYHKYMNEIRGKVKNAHAVAPEESKSIQQLYQDGDIYVKGSWILHTLRNYVGDKDFFTMLRRMAYPDPAMEKVTDGRQCRFATTDDFIRIANKYSGMDLKWFFDVYVRQPKLPELKSGMVGNKLELSWETPNDLPFFLPVDVKVGDKIIRVEMKKGKGDIEIPDGTKYEIDPDKNILMKEENAE